MKLVTWTLAVAALAAGSPRPKMREIAGVRVIDTPLVRAAEAYARQHSNEAIYAHIMRSWLYGVLLIQADDDLAASVDLEVHAVSAILHDLGWDRTPGSSIISADRRFEVDGAFAAKEFIERHESKHDRDRGADWDQSRLQLVWDAIALHAIPSIANYKEVDVQVVHKGIAMEWFGPATVGVAQEDYDRVNAVFPKESLKDGINDAVTWLCRTKPNTTYESWQQAFGDELVEGYNATGSRAFDFMNFGFPGN